MSKLTAPSRGLPLGLPLALCLAALGCDDDGSEAAPGDASTPVDASAPADARARRDAFARRDARVPRDASAPTDGGAPDMMRPAADAAASADMGKPPTPDMGAPPNPDAGAPPPGACEDWALNRRPYFGDLHVHTSWSFDSYTVQNTRNAPDVAYAFARGEEIGLPPFDAEGNPADRVRLQRPLDFAAVTDHSEFLGEVAICLDPEANGYNTLDCINFRNYSAVEEEVLGADISFLLWGIALSAEEPERLSMCERPGVNCGGAAREAWDEAQRITEAAYDRCSFTALHGYEYTGTIAGAMNHRNVIFRNANVPEVLVTYFETQNWEGLANALKAQCREADGCRVMAIPHNPNWSQGNMFAPTDGAGGALTAEAAALRAEMEPVLEIIQTKQESECRNGFVNYPGAADEFCAFEKNSRGVPWCQPGEVQCATDQTPEDDGCVVCLRECGPGETNGCQAATDYVRNTLKLGLEQWRALGVNPFKHGFIGSTDTHAATPGEVTEDDWRGHHASIDADTEAVLAGTVPADFGLDANPGGLAVVYAEQNSREAIWDALKRRETYATSGNRPTVRFFGGWGYPDGLCDDADLISAGYAGGVPMGGDLTPDGAAGAPRFALWALRDPQGQPLQRLHIVKVWLDPDGTPRERVFDVTPDPDYGATVDVATCETAGPGRDELCTVWSDPDFDATAPAAWYARVVENPSCRWNRYHCNALGVDCAAPDAPMGCCDPEVPQTIQERAWTSPIWYTP